MATPESTIKLLKSHGKVRPQPSSDWKGPFDLPEALQLFYHEVGPANITIDTPGNPYFLPSLSGLWKFQAGYSWNSMSRKPIEDWNPNWLVVGDCGGDPFILDLSNQTVLSAIHGEGEWAATQLFPDLNSMAACLALLGTLFSDWDGDGRLPAALRKKALAQLTEVLGSDADATRVLKALGWT